MATRNAPAFIAAFLGVAAAIEALARGASTNRVTHASPISNLEWLVVAIVVLLALAETMPVWLFWGQPAVGGVAVSVSSLLSLALFQTLTIAGLAAQLIVLYRLGRWGSQILAAGLAAPFLILALAVPSRGETAVLLVLLAAMAPAAAWAGAARRARAEALAHGAAREIIADTLLEHTARGERARISRELHDVVAHHISMIAVQAETARLTTPGMPDVGARRLSEIGDTARTALTEMRRLLGVLRTDTRSATADSAIRQPQPSLKQLNELIDAARDTSGAGTRLIISGQVATLDQGTELAAYRIIQEALTNARRHAPGAAVDVELRYTDDALMVRVRDNGPGPPADPQADHQLAGGHGLLGMHERAAAVGGDLRTGPAVGGGFLVEATLPVSPDAAL